MVASILLSRWISDQEPNGEAINEVVVIGNHCTEEEAGL
jgi:hypothetical protein